MTVKTLAFGGERSKVYELLSETGVRVLVSNFGARLVEFWVPDGAGERNILVSYTSDEAYRVEDIYIGAMVGPVAGRLSGARIEVSGRVYDLTVNERNYNLHGGPESLHTAYWQAEILDDSAISFSHTLPDGQNGFPGPIRVKVVYRLEKDRLSIEVEGVSQQDTVFNPTNHAYFNLDGDITKSIAEQKIHISANRYAPLQADNTPTGELLPVEGTPFDFREAAPFSQGFGLEHPQNSLAQGYDHGWELVGYGPHVSVKSSDGTIGLEMTTSLPAVVIYTYGWPVAEGRQIVPHGGFTLETQVLPDAMKYPHFGNIILKAGETFSSQTEFQVRYPS